MNGSHLEGTALRTGRGLAEQLIWEGMAKPQEYARQRIVYLGPLGVGMVVLFVAGPCLILVQMLQSVGYHREFDWGFVGAGVVGSCVAALLATWAFNIVAPLFGGVRVWLATEPPEESGVGGGERAATRDETDFMQPGPGTSERKKCPECDALIRADRSFCPECGHDIED